MQTNSNKNNLFIIGDVHGCFNTFSTLLENWQSATETLIQVGDLIDRGNFSPLTLKLAFEMRNTFKEDVHFLKGNHEEMMVKYLAEEDAFNNWLNNGGKKTLAQFKKTNIKPATYFTWVSRLPLCWSNDSIMITHAGISNFAHDPFDTSGENSVLWNRQSLKNIGKIQVIGHTPLLDGKPEYTPESNSWNIDTGAYKGICLTGIKMKFDGTLLEVISIPTDPKDIDE